MLHDPDAIVREILAQSAELEFDVSTDAISWSISKGLAAENESYRRIRRDELFFAQSLLDELRLHMVQADDRIHRRPPQAVPFSRLESRASRTLLAALERSFVLPDPDGLDSTLRILLTTFREQIIVLHDSFDLDRSLESDLFAADAVLKVGPA